MAAPSSACEVLKPLEPIVVAREAVDVASDKQAVDILLLDVREITSYADYLVIMSGETARQMNAVEFHTYDDRLFKYEGMAGLRICEPYTDKPRLGAEFLKNPPDATGSPS